MVAKTVLILGIESSCDDTAAAVIQDGVILSNVVAGQKVHQKYGGVVPELASRAHQQHIIPVVDAAIKEAGIDKKDLSAIAFTQGPGLLGSLLVGSSFAKTLSYSLDIPLIPVNHMQGHVLAHFIKEKEGENKQPAFPFLCLTVSGGHTQIVLIKDHDNMEVIGETIDDAAGEAFDKAAKILGLPYPGGPLIDKYAQSGNPLAYEFAEPRIEGYNFSFSGMKTSFLYFIREQLESNPNFMEDHREDICASIQHAIVSFLMKKLKRAARETGIKEIAIAGGVSANSGLRKTVQEHAEKFGWNVYIPKMAYCTDNAAMIAITGYYKYLKGEFAGLDITPKARMAV